MPKIKNVYHLPVEAVMDDVRTVITFEPGEVKDIPYEYKPTAANVAEAKSGEFTAKKEVAISRILDRYPNMLVLVDDKKEKDAD